MLTDAQVERYSRQVLLPDVGGRGQARLLAARVALAGDGDEATVAATLLARAGIGGLDVIDGPSALPSGAPDCRIRRVPAARDADVHVDLRHDRWEPTDAAGTHVIGRRHGADAVLVVLVGRPCAACLPRGLVTPGDDPGPAVLAGPAALALGALAAAEALRVLLDGGRTGRRHVLDFATGDVRATPLPATGCARCGGSA